MTNGTRLTATSSVTLTMIFLMASLVLTFSYDVRAESNAEMESVVTPDLQTFATYDEMRRYFANRNLRSLRYLDNPEDDSYIDAFNKHNEQPVMLDIDKLRVLQTRPKRSVVEKNLPNEPKLLKFEISDAVEPSDEVKEIIRQHRSQKLGNVHKNISQQTYTTTTTASSSTKVQARKVIQKNESKRGRRMKRASFQQPENFKVKFIPFKIEDAREPDESIKQHIKRMRALETEQLSGEEPRNVPAKIKVKKPHKMNQRVVKLKRSRRNTPKTQPEMFKFELEDAKEPDESLKKLFKLQEAREKKQLKDSNMTTTTPANFMESTASTTHNNIDDQNGSENDDHNNNDNDDDDDDQHTHESRRFYRYKEAPNMKTRKSLNSLPHEVQKVITHLLTEQQEGKAYIKYIPAEQMDYGHLKSSYHTHKLQQPVYGTKLKPSGNYAKYVLPAAAQNVEPLQVHAVPVVEKVHYIYPQTKVNTHAHLYQAQAQPIVVQEPATRPPMEVHHTYAADLTQVHIQEAIKDIPAPQFRPSKPDPILDENKLAEGLNQYTPATTPHPYKLYSYGTAPESYYQSYAKPHIQLLGQQQPAPVIKIEYHAPSESVKENYKELQEFKELSTLIGKSPEDQMHGLTYLLAKEMQRQSKKLGERPQDSTSPILFHPKHPQILKYHRPLSHIPGRLMALGKGKEYIPIVESTASADQSNINSQSESINEPIEEIPKESHSQEIFEYGLSPNYNMATAHAVTHGEPKLIVEQVIHHSDGGKHASHEKRVTPEPHHRGEVKLGAGLQYDHNEALQYASKYAFGYRIRDFHTGNDFGHKQNRDLDGVTRGQYHILLPDGRIQNVIYHADDTGFHADVSFESGH